MAKPLRENDTKVLTDVEHCLLRPAVYIGSIEETETECFIYEEDKLVSKTLPVNFGFLKLFDETITNSIDEAIRTNFEYANKIKVVVDKITGGVSIEDNGRGLPIEQDKITKKWTPEVIFTQLRAGSNFDDDTKKNVAGQNGMGVSLVNIYSKLFLIDSCNGKYRYQQTFENNLSIRKEPKVTRSNKNYTKITYTPNYNYFKVTEEFEKHIDTFYLKRIKDLSFAYPEITFYYQGVKVSQSSLKEYLSTISSIFVSNENAEVRFGLFPSDTDFQHMSFVNGANTYNGGSHVDYTISKIVEHIKAYINKKYKLDVKPIDIKTKLFLILAIRMRNATFESQSKTKLIAQQNFKELIDDILSKRVLDAICKQSVFIDPIVETYKIKQQAKENLELKKISKTQKKVRIEKYYPASKEQKYCILSEGESACSSILSSLGREFYSYFALKGKPLNALECDLSKIKNNDELKNLITILNLNLVTDVQMLSHEKIVLAVDSDLDGKHIMALLLAFFKRFTPSLLKNKSICYLRTPLLFAKKNDRIVKFFFTMEEYKKYMGSVKNPLKFSYVKGLGTWESNDLKSLFTQYGIDYFIKPFEFDDTTFDNIENWLSKKSVEFRKENLRGKEFKVSDI